MYVIVPLAENVTAPLVPCVTEVTVRPGFSNVSLVSALKVTAVSSVVDTVSATTSATGVTVTGIVLFVEVAPSLAWTVIAAEPL